MERENGSRRLALGELTVALWVVLIAGALVLGADLLWVVAMGDRIRADGAVPTGVPFASAPQKDWPNPTVLAQVLLSAVHSLGWWALPVLHLALVAATLGVLVIDARRMGADERRLAVAVSLAVAGAASALVVVRFPSLSLLPFVLLGATLRGQEARPTAVFWLVPPLMVLWGNLHGAVLVGLAVLGAFTVLARAPSLTQRALVALASASALVLTSAGSRTPVYYIEALRNEAAARRTDLWSPIDLGNPLDLVMVLAALALLLLAAKSLRRWEWLVVIGLVVGTVSAARNGVWLVLFLAPVAAIARGAPTPRASAARAVPAPRVTVVVSVLALVLVSLQLARRPAELRPPGQDVAEAVVAVSAGGVVLAREPEAETFAQAGAVLWAVNPIDAFRQDVQGQFLDFLHSCTVPAEARPDLLVVAPACADGLQGHGWRRIARDGDLVLLVPAS